MCDLTVPSDIWAIIDSKNGPTYLSSLDSGLERRFPFATRAGRQAVVQPALHRQVLVMTPMGSLRRPPNDSAL